MGKVFGIGFISLFTTEREMFKDDADSTGPPTPPINSDITGDHGAQRGYAGGG